MVTKTWTGAGFGNWSNANRWSPPGVPTANDDVVLPASAFVGLDVDATVNSLESASPFTVTAGLKFTALNGIKAYWFVGVAEGATLNVSGSGITTDYVNVSDGATLNISGQLNTIYPIFAQNLANINFDQIDITGTDIDNALFYGAAMRFGSNTSVDLSGEQALDIYLIPGYIVRPLVFEGATIKNGTISDYRYSTPVTSRVEYKNVEFQNITYIGNINLDGDSLLVSGEFTVKGDSAPLEHSTRSVINMTNGSSLTFVNKGESTFNNAIVNIDKSSLSTLDGKVILGSKMALRFDSGSLVGAFENRGTIDIMGAVQNSGHALDNHGSLTITSKGSFEALEGLANEGSIKVQGGDLIVQKALSGDGILEIGTGGSVTLNAGTAEEQVVGLIDGELRLSEPGAFDGQINDFNDLSDLLNLIGVHYDVGDTVALTAGNLLQVTEIEGGVYTFRLNPAENFEGYQFSLSDDGAGGTNVAVTCYCAGTLIATPGGQCAVEDLAIDDVVLTADGDSRPVLWIGRQTVFAGNADPVATYPVHISAGALAAGIPARDLFVSPDHAMLVDGILIQAGALVNGTSIRRMTEPEPIFSYYHLELEDHALVLANGAPAETFVDNVTRRRFDNYEEYKALFGARKAHITELAFPRAKSPRQIPRRIRERLATRAAMLGFAAVRAAA